MEYTYTTPNDPFTNEPSKNTIVRSDGLIIPTDPANSDYQVYLTSLNAPTA